jgi:hypothetical protein
LQPTHVQPQDHSKSLNRSEYYSPPLAANVLAGLQLDNPLLAAGSLIREGRCRIKDTYLGDQGEITRSRNLTSYRTESIKLMFKAGAFGFSAAPSFFCGGGISGEKFKVTRRKV